MSSDTARSWSFALESVTAEEAGDAVRAIIAAGASEFPPNPTKILEAVKAARPPVVMIERKPPEGSMTAGYKMGDRHYVGASRDGLTEYDKAMQARGMQKIVTGFYERSNGRREYSFVYKKI